MLKELVRTGDEFTHEFPHPCGNIPARLLPDFGDGTVGMEWKIFAGRSYPPESHPHGHRLEIIEGTGVFRWNGINHEYHPGSVFNVKSHEPHGFVQIDENTLVQQTQERP